MRKVASLSGPEQVADVQESEGRREVTGERGEGDAEKLESVVGWR